MPCGWTRPSASPSGDRPRPPPDRRPARACPRVSSLTRAALPVRGGGSTIVATQHPLTTMDEVVGMDLAVVAQKMIEGLGGPYNVLSVEGCLTRLRVTVADPQTGGPGRAQGRRRDGGHRRGRGHSGGGRSPGGRSRRRRQRRPLRPGLYHWSFMLACWSARAPPEAPGAGCRRRRHAGCVDRGAAPHSAARRESPP